MPTLVKRERSADPNLRRFIPDELIDLADPQRDLPRIAKDPELTRAIDCALSEIPTSHSLHNLDSRRIEFLKPESVHLVVTSPPYWTSTKYQANYK